MHTLKITSAAVHFFKTSSSSSSSFIYIALLLFSPNFSGSVSHQHALKKKKGVRLILKCGIIWEEKEMRGP